MDSKNKIFISFIAIFVVAAVFLFNAGGRETAIGQSQSYEKNDFIVMPLQGSEDGSSFVIIDTRLEKIMIYDVLGRRSRPARLKLAAVRSFSYDKLLDQYNNAEPLPDTIKDRLINVSNDETPVKQKDLTDLVDKPVSN